MLYYRNQRKNLLSLLAIYQKLTSIGNVFFLSTIMVLIFHGCASYKIASPQFTIASENDFLEDHWLYDIIPRHRSQIRWYDFGHWISWALFGNDDAGIFGEGEGYLPSQPSSLAKGVRWMLRNPFHNFCFYVIGNADRINNEITLISCSQHHFEMFTYSPVALTDFADEESSFFLGFHGWKPFVSLRISYGCNNLSECYFGWRKRGNFGIKCIPIKKKRCKKIKDAS